MDKACFLECFEIIAFLSANIVSKEGLQSISQGLMMGAQFCASLSLTQESGFQTCPQPQEC